MEDVIYLVVNRHKVDRMTKNLPQLSKGEIPVKLTIRVEPTASK